MNPTINNQDKSRQLSMRKFVNNLDLLVGFDDDTLYKQTTTENVHAMIQKFQVVDSEGQKFTICSPIQKFKIFGPGVYLMFKFLKYLMLMFGIISLIALFQVILLLKSPFYQGYQDIVRINLLRFTIASIQPQYYNIYIVLDVLIVITVLVFMIFWSQKLRSYANNCNQAHPLPSYQTVQLKKVNNNLRQQKLRQYLKQLNIQPFQIYTARNYGVFLKHYTELTEIATQFRILRQIYINQDSFLQKHRQSRRILQKFIELKQKYCSIKIEEFNYTKYKPVEVFIVLKSYHQRENLLKINNKKLFNSCVERKQLNQFEFKACQVEPEAIAWQNIGIYFVNYAARAIILFIMLCIMTLMGVLIIFMLQILQTASIGDAYYYREETFNDLNNHSLLLKSKSLKSIQQVKPQADYGKLVTLIILTPIVIFICKKLIMGLLSHFVYFRKYPSQVSRIKSQTITLTIFYFFVVGALHLILYLKTDSQKLHTISLYQLLYPMILKMFQITNFNPASIHLYSDFSLEWYKQATFFIIIIGSTSFNISNCYKFIINTIAFHYHKRKASKQKTLYGVKKQMHGIDLHIEHVNASMIVITFFVLLYGCSIPLTVIFGLINLVVLFYITKFTFIKYGKKPLRLGHSISRTVVNLILIGILIHCLMTPIFLGAEGIGIKNMHQKLSKQISQKQINNLDSHFSPKVQTVTQRFQKFGPIYLTIAAFTLLYLIFRKIFHKKIIQKIKQKLYKTDEDQDICKQIEHPGEYPSYSMHNNPHYSQIIKNIYLMNSVQAQRLSCPIPQQFQNLKSLHEITDHRSKIKSQILQINRQYLNRQKYPAIYAKIQQLPVIKQYSQIQVQSQLFPDKKTNDRFKINCQPQQQS